MAGDFHAALLLLVPAAAMAVILSTRPGFPSVLRLVLAPLFVCLFAWPATLHHRCREPNPSVEWIIPGACALAVLWFVPRRSVAGGTAAAFLAISVFLSMEYSFLTHSKGYTGNPAEHELMVRSDVEAAAEALAGLVTSPATFPPGWLREVVPGAAPGLDGDYSSAEIRPQWHTWMTGLHTVRSFDADLWYPGGPLQEGIKGLELRERRR